ncbi:MAG TPA: sugar ABC transporter permease [Spirochaetia bacterium]|nr:sugar ABC transporter permease [Spirochaetia bacterium]
MELRRGPAGRGPRTNWLVAAFFLGPTVAAFIAFSYLPLGRAVYMSLHNYNWMKPPGPFVGLSNYLKSFRSLSFRTDLANSAILFLFSLALGFWVPILQALLLDQIAGPAQRLMKYFYLLPMAIPAVASFLVWKWIWNPSLGLANAVLALAHIPPQLWLGDPRLVKLTLRLPYLLGGGMNVMIILAAIQGVSPELHEAAEIDGAGAWQRMWNITVPGIWHIVTILFILNLTGALLAFDDVFVMTGGGPGTASTTIVYGIYLVAFRQQNPGQGSAWAVLVLVLTLIITGIQLRLRRSDS